MKNKTYFIGLDLETGGLNDSQNRDDKKIPLGSIGSIHYAILEVAIIIYDQNFKQVGNKLRYCVKHSEFDLENKVGEWSKNQFKNSLMKECIIAENNLSEIDSMVSEYLLSIGVTKNDDCYMLGNSIRLDFEFVSAQMPKLKSFLHYRLLDVSTLKVLFTTLYGEEKSRFEKKCLHSALDDIEESEAELRFYIDKFIK